MKTLAAGLGLGMALLLAPGSAAAAQCGPEGNVRFICGPQNAEDLVGLPESDWVIASGMADAAKPKGQLYLLNRKTAAWTPVAFAQGGGLDEARRRHNCPGGPDTSKFAPHGLSLRTEGRGRHVLYVVNHGGREAVETFDIDARSKTPRLTWTGCAVLPAKTWPNSVAALPNGGFVVTNMFDPTDPNTQKKLTSGENSGYVLEWQPKTGWTKLVGSDMSGPNGIEVSADGKWLYVASWPTKTVVRLPRGAQSAGRSVISVGFLVDNLRRDADGSIVVTGQHASVATMYDCASDKARPCHQPFAVARIDPATLRSRTILRAGPLETFGNGTAAVAVGSELWIGTFQGDRIARFRLDPPAD